eukprot:1725786-Alexandrium_andersonii.AAC.1
MSASLVGSEMCIRDRRSALTKTAQNERSVVEERTMPQPTLVPLERRPNAVSYTHLTLPTICSV